MNKILSNFRELETRYSTKSPSPGYDVLLNEITLFSKYLWERNEILDIGCGKGASMELLIKQGFKCTGTDIVIDNLYHCKKKELEVYWADVCNLYMFDDESIDNIFCRTTLNYVYDLEKAISELDRILRKNGKIYVGVGIGLRKRWNSHFESNKQAFKMLTKNRINSLYHHTSLYQDSPYFKFVGVKG